MQTLSQKLNTNDLCWKGPNLAKSFYFILRGHNFYYRNKQSSRLSRTLQSSSKACAICLVIWLETAQPCSLNFPDTWLMRNYQHHSLSSNLNTALRSTSEFMFEQGHIIPVMVRNANKFNALKSVHLKSKPASSGFDDSFMNMKTQGALGLSRIS